MASPARAEARRLARQPKERDVAVVYCRPDDTAGQFTDTLGNFFLVDGIKRKRILVRHALASGPRIAEARNTLVEAALDSPMTRWVWMIDADMSVQTTTLYRMLDVAEADPNIKVLGALAFAGGRQWMPKPAIYSEPSAGHFENVADYPDDTLIKVAATGAACLLMHREVLEAVYREYKGRSHVWFEESTFEKKQYGEDITFCRRARKVGYDIFVHTGIEVGHMKTMPLHSGLFKVLKNLNPHEAAEYEASFKRAMGAEG